MSFELFESQDYANQNVQIPIWRATKSYVKAKDLSREKFYDDMAQAFAKAIENKVEVVMPKRNKHGELDGFKRFAIPPMALMGDPRWFSYYLEELCGQPKRPVRFSMRVTLLHLYLHLKGIEVF